MNTNLLLANTQNLDISYVLIGAGVILGCTLCYLIISKYANIPTKNMEAITNEEIDTIINENMVAVTNGNVEDFITDSDSETEVEFDSQSTFDSDSTSDTESILNDPDLFFMPNVDFDVCPIEELKFFEFNSLYAREIVEHSITDADIMEFLSWFSKEDLATNWINDVFIYIITLL
jgi:hypothetical protein